MNNPIRLTRNIISGWCLGAGLLAHASSLTITITDLPEWSEYADGTVLALAGTINEWSNGANIATVSQHRVTYYLPDIGSPGKLDSGWGDLQGGENIAFQVVQPGTWTSRIRTDFLSNEGNFRIAVPPDMPSIVEINAGPVPTIVDQDTATVVNGIRAATKVPVDVSRFAYPGGRWKALVMSYDDGHIQDRGLVELFNRHGIRGTFHINSGWFDQNTFINSAEIPTLYAGHEVSIHTVDHPDLTSMGDGTVEWEIGHCRYVLSTLVGHEVNSMSFPFGRYDRRVIRLAEGQGVTSSRSVLRAPILEYFPADYMKWHPTCHHADADWFADQFIARSEERLSVLFIWGHSYELDQTYANNSWAYMESLAVKLGGRGDTWYCGQGELRDYLSAMQSTRMSSNRIHNPSDRITVWAKLSDHIVPVRPGRTIAFPRGRVAIYPAIVHEDGSVNITYDPAGNGLSGSTSLWLHVGINGWQDVQDVAMTNNGAKWSVMLDLSNGVRSLEWIFTNDEGIQDDGWGRDWRLAVRPLTTGTPARAQAVPEKPSGWKKTGSGQNGIGDRMDLVANGGAVSMLDQGGFGVMERMFVNYDDDYLYLGADGVNMNGNNHGLIVFIGVDTLADGVDNLWSIRGAPNSLDFMHNLLFHPSMNVAIVLGDEYGDGQFPHFNLGNGYDYGQGIYRLSREDAGFIPVRGAWLNQYDGAGDAATESEDDDGDRLVNRWVAALPWDALNAPLGIRSLGQFVVAGVWTSDGVNGQDRYLSGNIIGDSVAGDLQAGHYGFRMVQLQGLPIGLPDSDSDQDGQPDGWTHWYFGQPIGVSEDLSREQDDADGDGVTNGDEYRSGTDPVDDRSVFTQVSMDEHSIVFSSVPGKEYYMQFARDLTVPPAWESIAGGILATNSFTRVNVPTSLTDALWRITAAPP